MCLHTITKVTTLKRNLTVYKVVIKENGIYVNSFPSVTRTVFTVGSIVTDHIIGEISTTGGGPIPRYETGFHCWTSLKAARIDRNDWHFPRHHILKGTIPNGTVVTVGINSIKQCTFPNSPLYCRCIVTKKLYINSFFAEVETSFQPRC